MSRGEREGHSPDALRWATDAHYEDAERYDRTYHRRRHDVAFYREMAAEHGGPVLELGVGTGRVALAIARDGHEVVGVERMPTMLERLRARLRKEPAAVRDRITLVRGDIRKFAIASSSPSSAKRGRVGTVPSHASSPSPARRGRVGEGRHASSEPRRFPLVIAPFNVLMHLYSRADLEMMLACVRAHLRPRGVFVLDVRMPDIRSFTRDPMRPYRCPRLKDRDGTLYDTAELFQYDAGTQVQMITSTYREVAEPHRTFVRPLAHRQFFPQELELLLHYNGLEIRERWGDFERGAMDVDCESQVLVTGLRRR